MVIITNTGKKLTDKDPDEMDAGYESGNWEDHYGSAMKGRLRISDEDIVKNTSDT